MGLGALTTLLLVPFPTANDIFYLIRFQAIGPMLRAKAWQQNDPEPDWNLQVTDSSIGSGLCGVRVVPSGDTRISRFKATAPAP
jgi:hypothetical protein